MRHARAGKKLGRDSAHRKALYSNLAGALIQHGRIKTTEAKAKAVKPIAEKMITLGRRGDIAARRQAVAYLRSKDVVHKLFAEVAPRYADRPGGYARIVKIGPRAGDAANMAYLELVDEPIVERPRRQRAAEAPAVAVAEEPDAAELEDEEAEGVSEEETLDAEGEDAASEEPDETEQPPADEPKPEEPDATSGPPPEAAAGDQEPRN